jgi:hypothetical protein
MIRTIGSNFDWTLQIWEYPFGLKFYYTPLDLDPTVEIKSGELTEGIRVSRPSPARYGQRSNSGELPTGFGRRRCYDGDQNDEASSRA